MGKLDQVFVRIRAIASRTFPWLSRIQISVCDGCDREHRAKWRQFAHTNHKPNYVCVARAAAAELTEDELTGMIAHELGHLVAGALRLRAHRTMKPSATTPASVQHEANEVSRIYFGIPLGYNKRGIQVPVSTAAARRARIPRSGPIATNPGPFNQALKELPRCIGGLDLMSHKTVSDLVFLAQHELDLYHEGEETDIRTPKQLAAVKAFVMKYRTPPARKNPESSPQFEFHLKPPGWTGAPCPICGCDAKNLRAKHRALKADEAHQWGARYIKRVKVCFGTDFSDEAIKTNPAGGLPLSFDVKDGGRWYDVIARHDGAAVGNIRVRRSEHLPKTKPDPRTPCYQVSDIEVVERMRRRGVATALYEAAAKVAFSEGFSMCSDFAQNLGQDAEAAWDSLRKKGIAYWEVPGNVDENFDYGRYVIPKVKA